MKPAKPTLRPIGPKVDPLPPGNLPDLRPLHGRWVRLDGLSVARHGALLFKSMAGAQDDLWTYMAYGPFETEDAFFEWLDRCAASLDPWFYAIVNRASGEAAGMGALMRADPGNGTIEIGNIWFSPALQRTREATEAIFLMIRHCFDDLGVRRLEWKCDALNEPSRRAAKRLGFTFEGIFRQHYIIKGRNRDTAWFSMLDTEWPMTRQGFENYLAESNFSANGQQIAKLRVG
jgi:RimJ/RimL family protein N-acetyltransferase